jgi:hypothetical protein
MPVRQYKPDEQLQYCRQQRQSELLRPFTKRMSRDRTGRLFNFHVSSFQQASEESIKRQVYENLILPDRQDAPPDTLSGLQRVCDQSIRGGLNAGLQRLQQRHL